MGKSHSQKLETEEPELGIQEEDYKTIKNNSKLNGLFDLLTHTGSNSPM